MCVHYNDTSWLIHLCRLTGYNADPESTEGQGIGFEMTSQVILLLFVLWFVFGALKNTEEPKNRGGLGTRLGRMVSHQNRTFASLCRGWTGFS